MLLVIGGVNYIGWRVLMREFMENVKYEANKVGRNEYLLLFGTLVCHKRVLTKNQKIKTDILKAQKTYGKK